VNIAANRDEQWQSLVEVLGRRDLLAQPEFLTREDRKANRHRLRETLEEELTEKPAAHWVEVLNARGIPCGPVLTVPQALESAQVTERALIAEVDCAGERLKLAASPVRVDGTRPAPQSPPPALGAQSDDILQGLGFTAGEIANLRKEGVI
jgi:formyl-CoA transferase